MWCAPKSSSSQPAVVDNYRRGRYEAEHNSPSNQRRITFRQQLYQGEHDAQLAVAMSAQGHSDDYDLDTAIALSKSMMDAEIVPRPDANEEEAIVLAQALSLSEVQDVEETNVEPKKSEGEVSEMEAKTIPDIEDEQFKNIGEVSKDAVTDYRHIV
jgi:hypothetical protein